MHKCMYVCVFVFRFPSLTIITMFGDGDNSYYAPRIIFLNNSPKHLLRLVCLSMKTFAEMTFPNGMNICSRSWSPNSWGRW